MYVFVYIYFEREERENVCPSGEGKEREGERIPGRLHTVSEELDTGLELMNCEIMTWTKVGCLTDWATQASQYCYVTFKGGSLDKSTVNANCFQETISERIWLFMSLARMIWVWLTVSILLSWWKHLLTLYSLQGCLAKRKPTLLHHERMITDRQLACTLNEINPAIISFFLPSV